MNFGHVIIQKDGKECKCGNKGCFESYSSMVSLKAKIASKKNLDRIRGVEMYEVIKTETGEIQEIVDEFLDNLNIGLSNYINIFEPEAIAIRRKLCSL